MGPLPISRPSQDCPQQTQMMPAFSAATGPEQGRSCLCPCLGGLKAGGGCEQGSGAEVPREEGTWITNHGESDCDETRNWNGNY